MMERKRARKPIHSTNTQTTATKLHCELCISTTLPAILVPEFENTTRSYAFWLGTLYCKGRLSYTALERKFCGIFPNHFSYSFMDRPYVGSM